MRRKLNEWKLIQWEKQKQENKIYITRQMSQNVVMGSFAKSYLTCFLSATQIAQFSAILLGYSIKSTLCLCVEL